MKKDLVAINACLFASILMISFLSGTALGQSKTDMDVLRMFYREKDLVVSATRYPKSIALVAENIVVVSAEEIEAMNAHTVADVLNRIPGLYVNFNQDFGAASLLSIQGSEDRHVLVLLDGIPWNFLNSGSAETNSISVGIIERIEVIRGPASSTWGSSLGGVVNILTKTTGTTKKPNGDLRASYGKSNTQDYRAQIFGQLGAFGYYLFGGHQHSDGLVDSRYFDNNSFYSKASASLSDNIDIGLTFGYSAPNIGIGEFPDDDISQSGDDRTLFATGSLDYFPHRSLSFHLFFFRFVRESLLKNTAMGMGLKGSPGERFLDTGVEDETTGARGKVVWKHGLHTLVLGVDLDRGKVDQTLQAGSLLQFFGVPETSGTRSEMDTRAIYANDTFVLNKWSITPGIRYDRNSITGSFTSPSLGITYQLREDSILRLSLAKGFTIPPLSATTSGGFFLEPNPSLVPEKVWSYQLGAETGVLRYLWLKGTLFHHDLENAFEREPFGAGPPTFNDLIINSGNVRRRGFELEVETVPLYNASLWGGASYVRIEPSDTSGPSENYTYNIGLRYDDKASFRAELFGHFIWWEVEGPQQTNYNDFVWDLNLNKRIAIKNGGLTIDVFCTAHNLFDGNQYSIAGFENPERWFEAGIRFKF
ncbi:TonB-dependent receptor plug domain-containing protein [Thermodesulfobacteriota bacterium]